MARRGMLLVKMCQNNDYEPENELPDISISESQLQYSLEFQDSRCSGIFSSLTSKNNISTQSDAESNVAESNVAISNVAESNVAESNVAESNVSEFNVVESYIAESNVAESNVAEFNVADIPLDLLHKTEIINTNYVILDVDRELVEAVKLFSEERQMADLDTQNEISNSTNVSAAVIPDTHQLLQVSTHTSATTSENFADIDLNKSVISNFLPTSKTITSTPIHELDNSLAEKRSYVEDVDSIAITNSSTDTSKKSKKGRPKKGRKRKVLDQNREIKKARYNNNEAYVNKSGRVIEPKKFEGQNFRCGCPKKCTQILTADKRKLEFEKFWSAGNYAARCALLQGYVKEVPKKRTYSNTTKRVFTRKYSICNISVCKKTFLNTFSISQSRINVALAKAKTHGSIRDGRGQTTGGKNKLLEERVDKIKGFIKRLPKYKSHYCRESNASKFLSSNLNLSKVYDLYKSEINNPVSFSAFKSIFYKDFNLRFKKPKKDTCSICDSLTAKKQNAKAERQKLEAEHQLHLEHASSLRLKMKEDLDLAKTDANVETLTFDMQKTHSLPHLPSNIVYYKRQLNFYNFGIHCGSNNRGYFYTWLEHVAGKGTQEIGSCLKKFIADFLKPTTTHLILWADSCGGQNRSIKLVVMLLYILQNHHSLEKITLRFLQPGHTFLPNDSEFGDVECTLKTHSRLYTDEDFTKIMLSCRRKNKFIVYKMKSNDFLSVKDILNSITNRKVSTNKQKIYWLKTFEIEINKKNPLTLFMKQKLTDVPSIVDISKRKKDMKNFEEELPLLWPDGKALSAEKVKDLKDMLKLIPSDAKYFYAFLKDVNVGEFEDDVDGYGPELDFEIEEQYDG